MGRSKTTNNFFIIFYLILIFYFYGFFRLPRLFLHPYVAERLDEYDILNQLEAILCNNWNLEHPGGQEQNSPVYQFAKKRLKAFLDEVIEGRMGFASEEEIKTAINNGLKKHLQAHPQLGFEPNNINLQNLKIRLKDISKIEAFTTYIFTIVDVACIPTFLSEWNLIDLTSYANKIGSVSVFAWMAYKSLDHWIWDAMCVGNLLHVINAVHTLWKEKLSPEQTRNVCWLGVSSVAECLYCLSITRMINPQIVNYLALAAKSLGLMAFLFNSRTPFFH